MQELHRISGDWVQLCQNDIDITDIDYFSIRKLKQSKISITPIQVLTPEHECIRSVFALSHLDLLE